MDGSYRGLTVFNSNFTGNRAVDGGAIYLNGDSTVSFCNFVANVATNSGGAIYISGTGSRIMNSNFTYNNATYGSAIYYSPKSQARLYDLFIAENHVFGEDTLGYGDICIDDATFSIPNDDVVFDYFTGTPRYMNYIGNSSSFKLDVVYVSHNGTGLGTSSLTPTTIDKALNLLVKENATIVFCEDMDVSVILSNFTNLVLRSNVGEYYTIKRKEGKNVFVITDESSVTIKNLTLAGGVEVGSNNKLDMDNVAVCISDGESGGIVYNVSSRGSIINSTFTGNKNIDHALTVNGNVIVNFTEFSNNNLTGSAIYYSSTGTGSINNSTFYNNTASDGVRNINIPNLSNVKVNDNKIDAVVKNVTISNDIYGYDFTITGYFDAGLNFAISNINVTIDDVLNTTRTVNVDASTGRFTTSVITGGVLPVGKYKLLYNGIQAINTYNVSYENNNFTINKVNVAANSAGSIITVTYGMADTIIISGTFNASQRVKYDGNVTLTISNGKYSIENISVVVRDGSFSAVLMDEGRLGADTYNVTVKSNGGSDNENFTVCEKIFVGHVIVNPAVVGANYTNDVVVVYGMNDTIVVEGTFNASSADYAVKYNGIVTISINNNKYSMTNTSVLVKDGKFRVIFTDQGKLGAGIYNITISSNTHSANENYTVVNKTWVNKVSVNKLAVGANYTTDVSVVYGMNNTIIVEGTFNASSGVDSSEYNGIVTVTIANN